MSFHYRFRKATRIISVVDLILFGVALFGLGFAAFFTICLTVRAANDNSPGQNETAEIKEMFADAIPYATPSNIIKYLWVILVVFGGLVVLSFAAGVVLCKASKLGADPKVALGQVRCWRNIAVIFTLASVIPLGIGRAWPALVLTVLLRGTLICLVWRYIDELNITSGGGGSNKVGCA